MECEVTGVRHRMGDGLTLEEKTQMAEQFVTTLPNGTPVILAAESPWRNGSRSGLTA